MDIEIIYGSVQSGIQVCSSIGTEFLMKTWIKISQLLADPSLVVLPTASYSLKLKHLPSLKHWAAAFFGR